MATWPMEMRFPELTPSFLGQALTCQRTNRSEPETTFSEQQDLLSLWSLLVVYPV